MKKLFFVFGLSLMTSGVFANENLEEKTQKKKIQRQHKFVAEEVLVMILGKMFL